MTHQYIVEEDFAAIYNEFYPKVLSYLKRLTLNREDAQDWTQEIFLSLYKRSGTLSADTKIMSYLIGAAHKQYAYHMRSVAVKRKYLSALGKHSTILVSRDLENKELKMLLIEALNSISAPACREIIRLRFFEEREYQEISKHLNIKPNVTRNQVTSGRKQIRRALSGYVTG